MKKTIILIAVLFLITGGILFPNKDSETPISPSRIVEIEGKIQAIMTEIPAVMGGQPGPAVAFIKAKVKDEKSNAELSVQIAPGDFLRLNSIFLKKDDSIKIKGFRTDGFEDIKSMEIQVQGKILVLRDRFGNGMWEKQDLRKEREDTRIR